MNEKFDELAKGLAKSVARRAALKKFGVGLAGVVLASLGFASRAEAEDPNRAGELHNGLNRRGHGNCRCTKPNYGCNPRLSQADYNNCILNCTIACGG